MSVQQMTENYIEIENDQLQSDNILYVGSQTIMPGENNNLINKLGLSDIEETNNRTYKQINKNYRNKNNFP